MKSVPEKGSPNGIIFSGGRPRSKREYSNVVNNSIDSADNSIDRENADCYLAHATDAK